MNTINEENYEAWFLDHLEGRLSAKQAEMLAAFLEARPDLRAELDAAADFSSLTPPPEDFGPKDRLKKSEVEAREMLLFDLAEGNLNPEDRRRAEKLLEDPEARKEYEVWKRARLQPQGVPAEKDALYRFGEDLAPSPENFDYLLIARNEGLLDPDREGALAQYIGADPERQRAERLYAAAKLKPSAGIFFPDKEKLKRKKSAPLLFRIYRAAAAVLLLVGAAAVYNTLSETETDGSPAVAEVEKETSEETAGTEITESYEESPDDAPAASREDRKPAESEAPGTGGVEKSKAKPARKAAERMPEELYAVRSGEDASAKVPFPMEHRSVPAPEPLPEPELLAAAALSKEETPVEARRLVVPEAYTENYAARDAAYKTLPEWAIQAINERRAPGKDGRRIPLLAAAERIVNKAEKAVEFSSVEAKDRTEERKGWTLRLGSLEISHNRRKQ